MASPTWLADEMLGKLARYLRFLGHDTEYAHGQSDGEIAAFAAREGRTLLTRDRLLARRVPGALLLRRTDVLGQLREVRMAFPAAGYELRFDRCSLCNGPTTQWESPAGSPPEPGVPAAVRARGAAVYRCGRCGKFFWDGSHTAGIRRRLEEAWLTIDP